ISELPIFSGSHRNLSPDDKFKYWSLLRPHRDSGIALTREQPDSSRCSKSVRLPSEVGSSVIPEQHDMSRCNNFLRRPNDSGNFDIPEQPDRPRYYRHSSLPIDSGSAAKFEKIH